MRPTVDETYKLEFFKDSKGYGDLVLFEKDSELTRIYSRSGSISKEGILKNDIPEKEWFLVRGPEDPFGEDHETMFIPGLPGKAWKQRLWPYPVPGDHAITSRLLIHPDGNKPGTLGCIGTQNTNAMELYFFFSWYFHKYDGSMLKLKVRAA